MSFKKKIKSYVVKHELLARICVTAQVTFGKSNVNLDKSIEKFMSDRSLNQHERMELRKDLRLCKLLYGTSPDEYFLFGLEKYSHLGRKEFLGTYDLGKLEDIYNSKKKHIQFRDKYVCYKMYESFYNRKILQLNGEKDEAFFYEFLEKYKQIIVKPLASSKGRGIYELDLNKEQLSFSEIIKDGPVILEEKIVQVEELSSYHPSSVNSIRVLTILTKEGPEILFSILRMGCGGSVIDNASSGGIVAEVDVESGVVCTRGYRENGEVYIKHPDTGKIIPGNIIPRWNELKKVVKQVAEIEKDIKIAGWDFALTDAGWIMIEGNDRPAFTAIQMCRKTGIRAIAEKLVEKI